MSEDKTITSAGTVVKFRDETNMSEESPIKSETCDICDGRHAEGDPGCLQYSPEPNQKKRKYDGMSTASSMTYREPLNSFTTPNGQLRETQRLKLDAESPKTLHLSGSGPWARGVKCHCPKCDHWFIKRMAFDVNSTNTTNTFSNLHGATGDQSARMKIDVNRATHAMMEYVSQGSLSFEEVADQCGKTVEEVGQDFAIFGAQDMKLLNTERVVSTHQEWQCIT